MADIRLLPVDVALVEVHGLVTDGVDAPLPQRMLGVGDVLQVLESMAYPRARCTSRRHSTPKAPAPPPKKTNKQTNKTTTEI